MKCIPLFSPTIQNVEDLPDSLVVKTWPSNAGHADSIPGLRAEMWHVSQTKKPEHKIEAILYQIR